MLPEAPTWAGPHVVPPGTSPAAAIAVAAPALVVLVVPAGAPQHQPLGTEHNQVQRPQSWQAHGTPGAPGRLWEKTENLALAGVEGECVVRSHFLGEFRTKSRS